MNSIKLSAPTPAEHKAGDLFHEVSTDEVYLLCRLPNGALIAFSLRSGTRWDEPAKTPDGAVRGLVPLGSGRTITIE